MAQAWASGITFAMRGLRESQHDACSQLLNSVTKPLAPGTEPHVLVASLSLTARDITAAVRCTQHASYAHGRIMSCWVASGRSSVPA